LGQPEVPAFARAKPHHQTLFAAGFQDAADAPALGFVDDEADAVGGAATARVLLPFGERETVIVGELFAASDVAGRDDPYATADGFGAAVGRAGVIDETGDVVGVATVDVVALVEIPDVNAAIASGGKAGETLFFATVGFGFGDFFADVFDDAGALGNVDAGIGAAAMDRRAANDEPGRFRARRVRHEENGLR